jgi:hypothetical protein
MADQIPPISGAPADMAWFKWAQNAIAEGLRERARSAMDTSATDKGLAASIDALARQIRDLQGRVSYSDSELMGLGTSWSSTQADDLPWGPPLTFTLAEPRRVSVEYILAATAAVNASTATSTANASIAVTISLNGVAQNAASVAGSIGAGVGGGAGYAASRGDTRSGTISARAIFDLPAGTHTVRGNIWYRTIGITGSGAGLVSAVSSQIFVDVLQPIGT